MCRTLLRDAVRGKTPPDPTRLLSEAGGDTLARCTSDTVVEVPKLADRDADRALIQEIADKVLAIMKETEHVPSAERRKHVLYRLDETDGGLGPFDD